MAAGVQAANDRKVKKSLLDLYEILREGRGESKEECFTKKGFLFNPATRPLYHIGLFHQHLFFGENTSIANQNFIIRVFFISLVNSYSSHESLYEWTFFQIER